MRYPAFLPEGGTIGFAAPSFGAATEPYITLFDAALRRFHRRGWKTLEGPNVRRADAVGRSAPEEDCGAEFTQLMTSPKADAVISVGGGELLCEGLRHVDFEAIRKAPPKWFMGYSDNTYLTYLLTTLCDTAAVYGPCAPSFGMRPMYRSLEDALSLLRGTSLSVSSYPRWESESVRSEEDPLAAYHLTEPSRPVLHGWDLRPFTGRFLGGCLDCLVTLLGTRFDHTREFCQRYAQDGIIWFLEACDLNVFDIRRALWQMREAGWFEHVRAFLFGRPLCMGEEMMGLDQYEAVLGAVGELGVPILMDLDLGHLPPMMPVISGACGTVHRKGAGIRIDFELR